MARYVRHLVARMLGRTQMGGRYPYWVQGN
jgi:hypothetical protein